MPQDFDRALDNLKNMLSTEEGKKDLENMIGAFTNNSSEEVNYSASDANATEGFNQPSQNRQSGPSNGLGGLDMNMMASMKRIMDEMGNNNSQSANLLSALRPYLSPTRSRHMDTALQVMKLSKLPNVIRNMKK